MKNLAHQLKCKSCGHYLDATESNVCNGICPKCNKKNLSEFMIICPECHVNVGQCSHVEVNRIGWCCRVCNIKMYKDL